MDIGVLGSEACLSMRIGFGLRTVAEAATGGLDAEADTVMMCGLWRLALEHVVAPAAVTMVPAPPVNRRGESVG